MMNDSVALPPRSARHWHGGSSRLADRAPRIPLRDESGNTEPPLLSSHPELLIFPDDQEWAAPLGEGAFSNPPTAKLVAAEPPAEAHEGLESRFRRLAEAWHDATDFHSSTAVFTHPAYQEIIGMGPAVLPLLLKDLEETGSHWFWALRAITGENPVPSEARGKVDQMTEAWLVWGRERGVLS